MLSQKEIDFIEHWEVVRLEYSTLKSKIIRGFHILLENCHQDSSHICAHMRKTWVCVQNVPDIFDPEKLF